MRDIVKKYLVIVLTLFSLFCIGNIECFCESGDVLKEAKTSFSQNKFSQAIELYKKVLRKNSKSKDGLVGIINSYLARATYYYNKEHNYNLSLNDLKSATFYLKYCCDDNISSDLDETLEVTRKNLEELEGIVCPNQSLSSRFSNAKKLRLQGNLAASGYDFHKVLESSSNFEKEALINIGDIFNLLNVDKKAFFYYERALNAKSPNKKLDEELFLKIARFYDKFDDFNNAQKYYDRALKVSENRDEILNSLYALYSTKLSKNPKDITLYSNLGAICQKMNSFTEAIELYQKGLIISPHNEFLNLNLGTVYQLQKEYSKALCCYDNVLNVNKNNVTARYYKAQCLRSMKKNEEAIQEYKKVIANKPAFEKQAKKELFEIITSTLSSENLILYLKQEAKSDPGNYDVNYNLAYELHKQKRYDEAIVYYQAALNIDSKNIDTYINLAQAYMDNNKIDKVKQIIGIAKSRFPDNKEIERYSIRFRNEVEIKNLNKALVLYEKREYESALNLLNSIISENINSAYAYYYRAMVYDAMNNRDLAIVDYKKSISLDNKLTIAYYSLGVDYDVLKKYKEALYYYRKYMENEKNISSENEYIEYTIKRINELKVYDIK